LLMHLLADGTIDSTWPVGGRSMGSMPIGSQSWPGPRMVADGSGGTIIAWTGRGWDHIYAQRVLSDGTLDPAWPPATGTTVSAGPNKYDPMSVPDGSGGAIITWYESRPGGNGLDICAQRVRSDGRLGEEVSGVQDVAPFGLVLQPIRPNPLRTETFAVPFRVGGDGAVSIEVFDVAGRRITSRQLASVEPGFHSIEVSLGPSPVAGIYFVRLQQGTLVRTTTVTLLD
ncbi:MAG TPA: T9SS type A sorting domain-containing protein, partial [Candidatus Eisenbacteria bacterium]